MAARLKENGREELAAFKRRVKRQASLERIAREDENWLVAKVEEIERYVSKMNEKPDLERSLF